MNPTDNHQPTTPVPDQPQLSGPAIATTPMPNPTPAHPDDKPVGGINGAPQAAEDHDLIEKEWVVKAKEIVAANLADPYEQSRQLAALKADYMQKRYNKTVKLSE